jgi:hypothetical protein
MNYHFRIVHTVHWSLLLMQSCQPCWSSPTSSFSSLITYHYYDYHLLRLSDFPSWDLPLRFNYLALWGLIVDIPATRLSWYWSLWYKEGRIVSKSGWVLIGNRIKLSLRLLLLLLLLPYTYTYTYTFRYSYPIRLHLLIQHFIHLTYLLQLTLS